MQSAYMHMHSLIVEGAHAHLTNTRYVTFHNSRPGVIYLHAGKQEEAFARIVFDVSETSMGFHLFHIRGQKEVLLYSYNLGAPSMIAAMYAFAHEAEVRKPKDIDAWVIRTVAQNAGRVKKAANHLLTLHKEKDPQEVQDLLGHIREALGWDLHPHVETMYMLLNDEPDLDSMEDLSEDFFSDLDRSNHATKVNPIVTVPVGDDKDFEGDEEDLIAEISEYTLLDILSAQSTETLIAVYGAAFGERACRDMIKAKLSVRKMRNKLIDGIIEDNAAADLIQLCEMSDDDTAYEFAATLRK